MKNIYKNGLSLLLLACLIVSTSKIVLASTDNVPNSMQPNSIIIYDSNLDYTFEQGGVATTSDSDSSDIIASPGI